MGEEQGSSLPYVPGIDGLRALAVVAVLCFHLEFSGFSGGFLGVSLFFTLSGYLITQLILREHEVTGQVSLRRFWGRRFRRLMPAALSALVIVAILGSTSNVFDGPRLRGDLLAGIGYVANWRFASGSQSYDALFTSSPSPIQHFWSLAIEEQFYVLFPILMALVLWIGVRRNRHRIIPMVVLALLWIGSVIIGIATDSKDLVYYGTHTRAAELLTGALLAFVLPIGREISRVVARVLAGVALAAVVYFGFLVATVATSDGWLYDGGLAAFSFISVALVIGALIPGPLRAALSSKPLVHIGRISYGIYVFHWPVIIALDSDRVDVSGWRLQVLRIAVTVSAAALSARFVENPIRRRRVFTRPRSAGAAGIAGLLGATLVAASVSAAGVPSLVGLEAPDEIVSFGDEASTPIAVRTETVDDRGRNALRITVLGSVPGVADAIADALPEGVTADVVDLSQPGCASRPSGDVLDGCRPLDTVIADALDGRRPDLVVFSVGGPDRVLLRGLIGEVRPSALLERPELAQRPFRLVSEFADDVTTPFAEYPLLIWDGSVADALQGDLADIDARAGSVSMVTRPDRTELSDQLSIVLDRLEGVDDRKRVMVIGDSTSYGVAKAIDDVAGDDYDVLWAGGRNCPLVKAQSVRWWPDMEFDVSACPNLDETWAPLIVDFRPQLLLIVVSVPEQSEQMYEGDDEWHSVGDDVFDTRHHDAMQALIELAQANGVRVVIFDSPPITSGSFEEADFADRDRVRGWNRAITGFAETWPQIEVLDWSEIVKRAETANGGRSGSLREDGVHMRQEVLALLAAADFIPRLEELSSNPPSSTDGSSTASD